MADHIIPNDDGKGFTFAFIGGDVEFVDPIAYLKERTIQTKTLFYRNYLKIKQPTFPADTIERAAVRHAQQDWESRYKEILDTQVPSTLISLLKAESKKDQIKLLKGVQLTPLNLWAFIFKAHTDSGFTFSQYHSEHFPKNTSKASLPKMATLKRETGEIQKTGNTSLTDGQIKQAIEQRKVVVTKFLDKESNWHSFFITYKSIGGEETWRNGQPHFHYISDKFGMSREEAVAKFKSDTYPTTSVHIELLDYGEQPKK